MPGDDQVGTAVRLSDLDQARRHAPVERPQDPRFVLEQRGAVRARSPDLHGDVPALVVARQVELRVDHDLDRTDDAETTDRCALGQHRCLDRVGER